MKRVVALIISLALLALGATALADSEATAQTAAPEPAGGEAQAAALKPLGEAAPGDAALIDAARELLNRLQALCSSEEYIAAFTTSDEIAGMVAEAMACDYSSPQTITVLSIPNEAVDAAMGAAMAMAGVEYDLDDAQMRRMLRLKAFNMLPSMINSREGASWLAASTIMMLSDARKLDGAPACVAYIMFYCGEANPAAVVAAHVDEDGVASLAGSLCRVPEELRPLFDGELAGGLEALLPEELAQALSTPGVISLTAYEP